MPCYSNIEGSDEMELYFYYHTLRTRGVRIRYCIQTVMCISGGTYHSNNIAPISGFGEKVTGYRWKSMRVRVVDGVFGALAMAHKCVHLWVGSATCC